MSTSNQFDWVDFYKELANKLLQYKNNRNNLIEKVKAIYSKTGISMPTLETDNHIVDIDPFTFFGLFNKGLSYSNRLSIINAIAELFDIETHVPTSFDSIPVLNPQNATFYSFTLERGDNDIQDLWELFDAALEYTDNQNEDNKIRVSKYFDLTINRKHNGNSKITMALYWISPETFINLDQRNTWYIYESGKMPDDFVKTLPKVESKISSSKYFEIIDKMSVFLKSDSSRLKNFKELSFEAWKYSDLVNKEIKESKTGKINLKNSGTCDGDKCVEDKHYWLYSPGDGAIYWNEFYNSGIMGIGCDAIGDLSVYKSKNDMKQAMKDSIDSSKSFKHDAHATWQFAKEMKPGDIIFVKKGVYQIIGRGIVCSDYYFDSNREKYKNIRKVKWTNNGEWKYPGQAPIKFLTDITSDSDIVNSLNSLFPDDIEDYVVEEGKFIDLDKYTKDDFLSEVYLDVDVYNKMRRVLVEKKNIILQGAPGVGKTFAAIRLAYSIMGEKDENRIKKVQFHQNYSYEDFVMGYKPVGSNEFKLMPGIFYRFCKEAEKHKDKDYFFIIDEINRGNISKIFGELLMLIEKDYRSPFKTTLAYDYDDKEPFSVPKNLYIIGMMNTADRSLALMDYALRRRFSFITLNPGFESIGFTNYLSSFKNETFNRLIDKIKKLNEAIVEDKALGSGFQIGHSYFCGREDKGVDTEWMKSVVEFEIIPMLEEYWFDSQEKLSKWKNDLNQVFND